MLERKGVVDLVITGGTIIDGTGEKAFSGSIAINNGLLVGVGRKDTFKGKKTIDAKGLVIAPGFIDIHTHGDWHILKRPEALNYIHQGVTSIIGGNCGLLGTDKTGEDGIIEIAPFLEQVKKEGTALNFGVLAGYGTIRGKMMKEQGLEPTKGELSFIKDTIEGAMEDGAFGLSLGLEYLPGRFAKTSELIEMGTLINHYKGFLAIHMRDEQARILNSISEVMEIGFKSKVPVHISHLKACGEKVWGLAPTITAMIGMAKAIGGDVTADLYPYLSSSTGLSQLFPNWAHEGGKGELKKRFKDKTLAPRMKKYAFNQLEERVGDELDRVQFASSKKRPYWEGKTLKEVLLVEGRDQGLKEGIDLLMDSYLTDDPSIIYHYLLEDDVRSLLLSPQVMVCSDGHICEMGEGMPHPRSYGSFPRLLRLYSKENYLLSLEEAIMKMTSLPSQRLGLVDRGKIKEAYRADLVLFDLHELEDKGDFFNPHQYPRGIHYLLINGELVLDKGRYTGIRPGEILYRS